MPSVTKFKKRNLMNTCSFDFYFFGLRGKTMLRGTSIAFFPHPFGTNTESTQDFFYHSKHRQMSRTQNTQNSREAWFIFIPPQFSYKIHILFFYFVYCVNSVTGIFFLQLFILKLDFFHVCFFFCQITNFERFDNITI